MQHNRYDFLMEPGDFFRLLIYLAKVSIIRMDTRNLINFDDFMVTPPKNHIDLAALQSFSRPLNSKGTDPTTIEALK